MIKKHLISSYRHLKRQKLFTTLNIFGLAIGMSACWVIYRIVDFEFSYDQSISQKESIYRLVSGFVFDGKENYNGGVSKPLYQEIREQVKGIEHVAPVFEKWVESVEVSNSSGRPLIFEDQEGIASADSAYFNMVPYKWLVGNAASSLSIPEGVVLTESRAKQYFPDMEFNNMLDRSITYYSYNDTITRVVTGIVADLKSPTEFTLEEFHPLQTKAYELNQWTNTNGSDRLYLQLKGNANPRLIKQQAEAILQQKTKQWREQSNNSFEYERWLEIMPLRESHFSTYIEEGVRKASKPLLFSLMGIAVFLLLLACINYINMSIASIPQRTKEIGVRKTLGGSKTQLISQFLYETMITAFIAGFVSLLFSKLGFWLLKDIIPKGIEPFDNGVQFVFFVLLISIAITILAGLYPAWLIAKVKTINVFKSAALGPKRKGLSLQKTLIVFQFVIALVFITSALIVGRQLHYSLSANMGFNREAVVLVDIPWKYSIDEKYYDKQFPLLAELKTISGIQAISLGSEPMSDGYSSSQYEYAEEGKEPVKRQVFKKWVDTSYLHLYDMKLLVGRNLHPSDTTNEFVINETAVKAFGFASPEEAIGKFIGQQGQKYPIVGVVKDFHLRNFYNQIDPMAFESDKSQLNTFNIKLVKDASQWQNTIEDIESKWYQFFPPESFSYKFYDEAIEQMYIQEKSMATLINMSTAISIFISCLGLFGLAVLTAFQRTKEIGIRKVLGASVTGIVKLLSKEYVVLILLALVVASPIAWYLMQKWLEKFAYRLEIEWWIFVLAGMMAIIIALITVGFQAIKAAISNPVKSLRTE